MTCAFGRPSLASVGRHRHDKRQLAFIQRNIYVDVVRWVQIQTLSDQLSLLRHQHRPFAVSAVNMSVVMKVAPEIVRARVRGGKYVGIVRKAYDLQRSPSALVNDISGPVGLLDVYCVQQSNSANSYVHNTYLREA